MKKMLLTTMALTFLLAPSDSYARRRRKKFKGPIIVNQILRLEGTMTNNGAPTMEFAGIKEGDTLETGPKSAAVIRIPGLGIYRLGENTKLKLSKFGGRDVSKFDLFKGDLLSIYRRLGNHEVKTEEVSVSPNGNSPSNIFWIADLGTKAGIALWDGRILIKAKTAAKEAVAPAPAPAPAPASPPTSAPTPQAQAEISKSNVPVDSKQEPANPVAGDPAVIASPSATPTPAPAPVASAASSGFVNELTAATANDALKKYIFTPEDGVKEKEESDLTPPNHKIIEDLESLYALP